MAAGYIMEMTLSMSSPLLTLDDDTLKYCMEWRVPPKKKDMPSTRSRLDRMEPSNDTCRKNEATVRNYISKAKV